MALVFGGEVQAGDVKWGVMSRWVVYRTVRLADSMAPGSWKGP